MPGCGKSLWLLAIGRWLLVQTILKNAILTLMNKYIKTFREFYPQYLEAHGDMTNRVLHFTGASLFFILLILSLFMWNIWILLAAVFAGYFLPGLGHRFFEKNESFRSSKPVLCVLGAFKMYIDTWKSILVKKNISWRKT